MAIRWSSARIGPVLDPIGPRIGMFDIVPMVPDWPGTYQADHAMLEAAKINVDDPRAAFHWADALRFAPPKPYDVILCNPPFHVGRRADPSLGRSFIQSAARHLTLRGRFFMVANRHLPYEDTLKTSFATGSMLGELEGYKIYEAVKPKKVGR